MFCPQCGQQQASDATRFCSRCGFQLEAVAGALNSLQSICERVGQVHLDPSSNQVVAALEILKADYERQRADLSILRRENDTLQDSLTAVQIALEQVKEAAQSFKSVLSAAATFGGEQVVEL